MKLFTFKLKSIRKKLIILFIIFAIIPSSLLTIITFGSNQNTISQSKNQIESLQIKTIAGLSAQYSSIVNNWVYERSKTVNTFVSDPNLRTYLYDINSNLSASYAFSEIDTLFSNWIQYNPNVKGILLLNYTSGDVLFSLFSNRSITITSVNPSADFMIGAKALQGQAVQQDGVYLKGPFNSDLTNSLIFSFTSVVRPFYSDIAAPTEILSVFVDPNGLFNSIAPRTSNNQPINSYYQNIGLGSTGEIYLLNNQGIAISRSRFNLNDGNFILKQNDSTDTGFQIALKNGYTIGLDKNYLNQDVYGAYTYLGFNTTGTDNRESFLKSSLLFNLKWVLVVEITQSEVMGPISQIQNQQSITLFFIIGIIIILAGLVVVLAFYTANSFSKPISGLSKVSKSISNGDLTIDIEDTKRDDEVGELEQSFKTMINFLQPSITSISSIAKTLSISANEMASSSEEVNASSEEMSSVSQQISRGAQQQREFLGNSKRQMEEMGKMFSEKIAGIKVASNLIETISNQVNMLALNASIEAARAGEYGRGFAVVADNIRRLADDAKSSVERVNRIIGDLTLSISNSMDSLTTSVITVTTVAEETASGAEEASAATEEQAATMQELSASAQELAKVSIDLEEIVKKFKID